MSKRNTSISGTGSPASSNTLFKYFAKSPAQPSKTPTRTPNPATISTPSAAESERSSTLASSPSTSQSVSSRLGKFTPASVKACPSPANTAKRPNVDVIKTPKAADNDEDDEPPIGTQVKKRRRIAVVDSDSDSDQENSDSNAVKAQPKTQEKAVKKTSTAPASPPAKTKSSNSNAKSSSSGDFLTKLNALSNTPSSKKSAPIDDDSLAAPLLDDDEPQQWTHNKLEFIKPANIKDAAGRRPDHPEYDPTTLYVPKSYLESLTPGMRQWWDLKANHFDCVLFFKVGKFYELYHMDADIGVSELGFSYMRGEFAHSGFPEQSYDRMVVSLVERGFKVARTEQTETPDMMGERVKTLSRPTKFDRVVQREVCQVTNRGTQVFGQQVPLTQNHQANYMMAIAEREAGGSGTRPRFGVCFIDTSIGEFQLGEFDDDQHSSRLLTLLSHHQPVLVLSARGRLTARTAHIFKTVLANTLKEQLLPETQFWGAARTLRTMAEKYLRGSGGGDDSNAEKGENVWPEVLRSMQDPNDHLGITPHADSQLAISALGACLWYMSKCLVDAQIMAQARFSAYTPPDDLIDANATVAEMEARATQRMSATITARHMVLDSISLGNLRICNADLSLLARLDQCCTKFGRRHLQFWVCTPSCRLEEVHERQAAVRELMADHARLQQLRELLGTLPDLERQLSQIHTFGDAQRMRNHPDGRAILFEQHNYNRKKIQDFISTLNGFEKLCGLPELMRGCEAPLLRRLTQLEGDGFPDMSATMAFFRTAFDHEEALRSGVIAPGAGVDAEYDASQADIQLINDELNDYLVRQEKRFGCRIVYFGTDKKRFQLEIPEANARRADGDYQLEGQKKGSKPVKRYHTEETREFLRRMLAAEDRRNVLLKDLSRRMFEKFAAHYAVWKRCVDAVGTVDVLSTLATYGLDQMQVCFPEVVDATDGPVLELDDGFHPCLNASNEFIPNGVELGGRMAGLALLTGPNMGGKSTMMRQIGLLIVMAQMGCPIPATSCRMTLVDRIFTRLGAHDDIMAGHSTFLVELNETATILRHATRNSLVLLDELGRGTATYDGTAIAAAVVDYLAELGCRTMFSTHYHNLVENFQRDSRISLGHMACMVENESGGDDPTEETVTFLYKYTAGPCPKSYGFNAAKLAGMPAGIIRRAHELSKKVESDALQRKIFSKMMCQPDVKELRVLLDNLQTLKIVK